MLIEDMAPWVSRARAFGIDVTNRDSWRAVDDALKKVKGLSDGARAELLHDLQRTAVVYAGQALGEKGGDNMREQAQVAVDKLAQASEHAQQLLSLLNTPYIANVVPRITDESFKSRLRDFAEACQAAQQVAGPKGRPRGAKFIPSTRRLASSFCHLWECYMDATPGGNVAHAVAQSFFFAAGYRPQDARNGDGYASNVAALLRSAQGEPYVQRVQKS